MVHGQAVLPAAGFAEMALCAGATALGGSVALHRLEVGHMLPVGDTVRLTTQVTVDGDGARVEIYSRTPGGSWTSHAVARVAPMPSSPPRSDGPRRPAPR